MPELNADASTDAMAEALGDAAGDLEALASQNLNLQNEYESHGWGGMDVLAGARAHIDGVRDSLMQVAELIGVGGQIVRDAHLSNNMIHHANKESLGHS